MAKRVKRTMRWPFKLRCQSCGEKHIVMVMLDNFTTCPACKLARQELKVEVTVETVTRPPGATLN
jgi:RNase P protein component